MSEENKVPESASISALNKLTISKPETTDIPEGENETPEVETKLESVMGAKLEVGDVVVLVGQNYTVVEEATDVNEGHLRNASSGQYIALFYAKKYNRVPTEKS